ncbi:MAG TPA: hypothetical protein VJP85_02365 [Candidatus Baltobacteraceae bacterium]|nr:hypothetical protein [Candidatus Baltobacteraceae bacterium]
MTVRASFTFRNQGGATANGVRVRFNLPDGLVYLVGSGQLDGTQLDDEQGNTPLLARAGADIGDVAPGQERRIEIAYSVAGAIENGSTVELQAAVAAFELAPVGSNIVRLVARSRPALENALTNASIESRQHEPRPGGEATIVVRVHNAGESSAHDVVVVAPVPEHTSYIPNTARVNGRELERDLLAPFDRVHAPVISQTLPASATVTLQYRVRIDDPCEDGTSIVVRAQAASQETSAFALEAAALTIHAQPDFENERTSFAIEPAEAAPGARVLLRLQAYNSGTTSAENVVISYALAEGLIHVRGSVRLDGHPVRERKKDALTFDIGTIAARESVEFVAEATIASPMADASVLRVAPALHWSGGERVFEAAVTARSAPHFAPRHNGIARVTGAVVHPSDECEAVISIANDGSAAATDAVLHLHVDPGLDDVRVFDKNVRLDLENESVDLGVIDAYASRKITVRARVRTPYPDRSELHLGASLHTRELGETALSAVQWRVESHPAFSSQSSALTLVQDDVFRPNQLVDVFVRVRNEGTDSAQNVKLRLYVSPEARLETVEGATRERSALLFGEIAPGASAEARLGVRLLRSLARAHPVSIESVLSADAMLPVQLSSLAIVTTAEPNFGIGTLRSEPEEIVDAGAEVEFILHVRNSGDGPARKVAITVAPLDSLIYVPNSTSVNDLPVRDGGALSPLMGERGIVLSEVDPGIEATIRWREVVHNGLPSGEAIVRAARVTYDGDRTDDISAAEVKVRCAPAFANTISGLPFGLDGMLGPSFAGSGQRALPGSDDRFVELPPATPVARPEIPGGSILSLTASSNGYGVHAHETASVLTSAPPGTEGVQCVIAFDRDRLTRTLRFLGEARFTGLVTHLFAIRAFFPDAASVSGEAHLRDVRETLRETLDRVFIKLRMPTYVIAPRDLESAAARDALDALLGDLDPAAAPAALSGSLVLHGSIAPEEIAELRHRLGDAAIGTALPWAILARLLPSAGDGLRNYRELLVAAFDELTGVDETAFIDALQRKPYPVLDGALDVVRTQLAHLPA